MFELTSAFYTVVSGYTIFVLGQITINFLLNPIKKQKKIIGEIQDATIYYANVFSSMMNKTLKSEASDEFRRLATQLVAATRIIPFYKLSRVLFGLPSIEDIGSAHHSLVGLSNSALSESSRDTYKTMESLKSSLKLLFLNE